MDGEDCFAFMFHGLPVLSVFFAELPGQSLVSEIFRRDMQASLRGVDLPQQLSLAKDLYPVMAKKYDLVLDRDLDAQGLGDFLLGHTRELAYTYETAFCSPAMYSRLFRELADRANLRDGLASGDGYNRSMFFPVSSGHQLTLVHFGLGRLTGQTALA